MFNFFNTRNNPELAYKIFKTLSVGHSFGHSFSFFEQIQINFITRKCKCRQDILNKVIEICGEPTTPFQRYIYAIAYSWSNKEYRQLAIKHTTNYINNELWVGAYQYKFRNINSTIEKRKKEHLSEMYGYLFSSYIGIYDFEEALIISEKMIEIDISDPIAYMSKCEVLVRLNRLEYCKEWLEEQKKLPFYKLNKKFLETAPENWFYFTINRLLDDVNKKIEKGYVYRPRKRTRN